MMHKAWCNKEEVPYCFFYVSHKISRSQGMKYRRFESNMSKITRTVAAIKSLRFALFLHVLRYRLETWNIHLVGEATDRRHRELIRAPHQWKVSSGFLVHVLGYQFEAWYIHLVGSATHAARVSSQSGHSDLRYSQNGSKSFFFIYDLENYIEPSDLVHTLM